MAAVPIRMPEVTNGDLSSKGTMFLFTVMWASPSSFHFLLLIFLFRRSISIRWLSVPPADDVVVSVHQFHGHDLGIADDLATVDAIVFCQQLRQRIQP